MEKGGEVFVARQDAVGVRGGQQPSVLCERAPACVSLRSMTHRAGLLGETQGGLSVVRAGPAPCCQCWPAHRGPWEVLRSQRSLARPGGRPTTWLEGAWALLVGWAGCPTGLLVLRAETPLNAAAGFLPGEKGSQLQPQCLTPRGR